jgi:tetratricopeptide (TPR) repeat protein
MNMASAPALDEQTIVTIRRSLAAAGSGRMEEACRIAGDALEAGGDAAALNALLGSLYLGRGDADTALPHLRQAHALRPSDAMVGLNLASVLATKSDYVEASKVLPDRISTGDAALRLERLRGYIAQGAGDYAAAVAAYQRVVAMASTDWESWNNLGNALRCAGDFDGAIEALQRAVAIVPDAAPVRLNLANGLIESGKAVEAEAELKAMARDFPDDWRCLRELHLLLRAQAREEEALQAIEEAQRRNPEDLDLLLAVASQRLLLLDNSGAEAAYQEVVSRDPRNPQGNLGLAVVRELSNRIDDLAALVDEARARDVDADVLNFIRAFSHRRAKEFEQGLAAMAEVSTDLESARHAQLVGQLHDGVGNYDEAWHAFSRMNAIQREDPSLPVQRAAGYRQAIRRNMDATTPGWAEAWTDVKIDDGRPSPAFLVGFPRSGTTLLDTILMGHPQIEVLEEEPTFKRAGELLSDYANLPTAPRELVVAARDAYFEEAEKRTAMREGSLLIDKNPLLGNGLPLIRRIFPDAKIILALRHPCDVVLSCFTTNFKLNDGMSSFLDLDTTAELYDLSFSYFDRVQQLMPMATHHVVYDRLVADQETELKALFGFLGLPWDGTVLDHQKTALERGRIKTASYSQVAEPIYTRSSGRWRNYRSHLEPVFPVLKPWIDKFGYEI